MYKNFDIMYAFSCSTILNTYKFGVCVCICAATAECSFYNMLTSSTFTLNHFKLYIECAYESFVADMVGLNGWDEIRWVGHLFGFLLASTLFSSVHVYSYTLIHSTIDFLLKWSNDIDSLKCISSRKSIRHFSNKTESECVSCGEYSKILLT